MEDGKDIPRLFSFAFLPCAMINPQWLELPMPRTNFHGTKDVRATEVRLYFVSFICGILAFILSLLVPCSSLVCCLKKAVLIDCGISSVSSYTVKPVLVVTSIKQPTCIKQPEESCPKIHRLLYLNCIKQPPAFSSHILSIPWVAV